jgi:phosphopantetheinyl transferase (holo-ACP synthase)
MLYSLFWVIPRRLNFGTLCTIIIGTVRCGVRHHLWRWKCSEMSKHKIKMPGNHPKEGIQHSEHGESLKSRKMYYVPNFAYKTSSSKTNWTLHKEKNFTDVQILTDTTNTKPAEQSPSNLETWHVNLPSDKTWETINKTGNVRITQHRNTLQ